MRSTRKVNCQLLSFLFGKEVNYYLQNGKKVDMENAKSNYDIAKIAKDNSVRTLNLTKSQWEKTLDPYKEDITKYKNEYFDTLNKWLGIQTNTKYLSVLVFT